MKNGALLSLLIGVASVSVGGQAGPPRADAGDLRRYTDQQRRSLRDSGVAGRPLYRARGEERVRLANGESTMLELKVSDGR